MTHTRNTSIGAFAHFERRNCRFPGYELVYQSSHVLKERRCVWVGGFFNRKMMEGLAERAGAGAGAGAGTGSCWIPFFGGRTDGPYAGTIQTADLFIFSLPYRDGDTVGPESEPG
jgi:hypothetical protein